VEKDYQINEELEKELDDEDMLKIKNKYIYIDQFGVVETTDKLYFNKNEE
jgi:hypothetical protein